MAAILQDTPARPLRRWPRVLVLVAVGLLLVGPLAVVGWPRLTGRDATEAKAAAFRFFGSVERMDAELWREAVLEPGQGQQLLRMTATRLPLQIFQAQTDPVRIQDGKSAQIPFLLTSKLGGQLDEGVAKLIGVAVARPRGVLHLTKRDRAWKVVALVFPANETGGGPRLNFDRPTGAGEQGQPLGRAVPQSNFLDQFRVWDRERYEVAMQLVRSPNAEPAGAGQVGVSALALLVERMAGRAKGQPVLSTTRAGPFQIAVADFTEDIPTATGRLTLIATATNFPRDLFACQQHWVPLWKLSEVRGPGGIDLLFGRRWQRTLESRSKIDPGNAGSAGSGFGSAMQHQIRVPLARLTGPVTKVEHLRGELRVPLVREVHKDVVFVSKEPTKKTVAGVEVAYFPRGVTDPPAMVGTLAPSSQVAFATSHADRIVAWRALDSAGNEVQTRTTACPAVVPIPTTNITALEFAVLRVEQVEHPFSFTDLPLQRAGRPLEAPRYGLHSAPLTLRFESPVATNPLSRRYTITNHCQKAVEEVRFTVLCHARDGKELGSRRVTEFAEEWGTLQTPLVPPRGTTIRSLKHPHPAGTDRLDYRLDEVLFNDGTTWAPPAPR